MSVNQEQLWSRGNWLSVLSVVRVGEKGGEGFAGSLISAMLYGVAVALFFRCMGVLLNLANRVKGGIEWRLVAHNVVMLLLVTVSLTIDLGSLSLSFIHNRGFSGDDELSPGPSEYSDVVYFITFLLNQWLANGLLLRRCYIMYDRSHRTMAFPCLIYLASVGIGITYSCYRSHLGVNYVALVDLETSYLSITLSLNVLLTLMVIAKSIQHRRGSQNISGASNLATASHPTVVTMLVESHALYTAALLLYIVSWSVNSRVSHIFGKPLGVIQVIAPYLVTPQVSNRELLTNNTFTSNPGHPGSTESKSRWTSDDKESLPDENPAMLAESGTEAPHELCAGADDV